MAPNLGQGGNSALVDAAVLVDELRRGPDLPSALQAWQVRRQPKVRAVADLSGRLGALAEIQRAFADLVRLEQNELAVELTTAVPIDDKTATKVQKQLATATGLTVTMARTVDPAILGGVVLRVQIGRAHV